MPRFRCGPTQPTRLPISPEEKKVSRVSSHVTELPPTSAAGSHSGAASSHQKALRFRSSSFSALAPATAPMWLLRSLQCLRNSFTTTVITSRPNSSVAWAVCLSGLTCSCHAWAPSSLPLIPNSSNMAVQFVTHASAPNTCFTVPPGIEGARTQPKLSATRKLKQKPKLCQPTHATRSVAALSAQLPLPSAVGKLPASAASIQTRFGLSRV